MCGQEQGGRHGWTDVHGEEVLSLSGSRELGGVCNLAVHTHRVCLDVTWSVGMLCLSLLESKTQPCGSSEPLETLQLPHSAPALPHTPVPA